MDTGMRGVWIAKSGCADNHSLKKIGEQALELALVIEVIQFGELNQVAKHHTTTVTGEGV